VKLDELKPLAQVIRRADEMLGWAIEERLLEDFEARDLRDEIRQARRALTAVRTYVRAARQSEENHGTDR
jgi:hypothetical protein